MINNVKYESNIIEVMFNPGTIENAQNEWDNYGRAQIVTGNLSGKLRKALKSPPRGQGCP
jgi:hypothetical protein